MVWLGRRLLLGMQMFRKGERAVQMRRACSEKAARLTLGMSLVARSSAGLSQLVSLVSVL